MISLNYSQKKYGLIILLVLVAVYCFQLYPQGFESDLLFGIEGRHVMGVLAGIYAWMVKYDKI